MNTKEKALEIFTTFKNIQDTIEWGDYKLQNEMEKLYEINGNDYEVYWKDLAKQSAIISVDKILEIIEASDDKYSSIGLQLVRNWIAVKKELELL